MIQPCLPLGRRLCRAHLLCRVVRSISSCPASKQYFSSRQRAQWNKTWLQTLRQDRHQAKRLQATADVTVAGADSAVPNVAETSADVSVGGLSDFLDLGLDDRVLGNLRALGVHVPTPIQRLAVPAILGGANAALQSYTGSGKTLAYLLPVLSKAIQRAEAEFEALAAVGRAHQAGALQAVIVAPSRELAMQIVRVAQSLLPDPARGCIQQCIGGANHFRQEDNIKQNKPLMVVGTPGRLAEFSRSGVLRTHPVGLLVLDEVDQLLSPHFREDMVRLVEHSGLKCPAGPRQTVLVSATLTPKVLAQCAQWAPGAQHITTSPQRPVASSVDLLPQQPGSSEPKMLDWDPVSRSGRGGNLLGAVSSAGGMGTQDEVPDMPPQLRHAWVGVDRQHRVDAVRRAIHALGAQRALVFMNFQHRLKDTEYKLAATGLATGCLSGDMGKLARSSVLGRFRKGTLRALVVSDVAARGLDLPECDVVINLELPSDAPHYAHRAGRTGRMGREGVVVSLVEPHERFVVERLARRLGMPIPEMSLAGGQLAPASNIAASASKPARAL